MDDKLRYTVFHTVQGWVGCLSSPSGLLRTTLPQTTPQRVIEMLDGEGIAKQAVWSPHSFTHIIRLFSEYFNGKRKKFRCALDFGRATVFQKQVWEATRSIPFGETRSYSWVAEQIGKPAAVRAVGRALGKNPLPIVVPCHRVIASNGSLCGFNGGLEMKRDLLRLEGTNLH